MQVLKKLVIICVFGLLPFSGFAQNYLNTNTKYDKAFKAYSNKYMPGVDWKILKAQCWQESRFKAFAVSPVGAKGICQFMPATWRDMEKRHNFVGDVFDPNLNIEMAASYMAILRSGWSSPRPETDRISLSLASYNAGFGNLLKAQRKCEMALMYDEIIQCLPDITHHHSKETIDYVSNIWNYWFQLKF